MNLDFEGEEFKSLLDEASDVLLEWHQQLRGSRIYQNFSPPEIQAVFDEPLPELPEDPHRLIQKIRDDVFRMSNFNPSPNYYAYITGGGNQAAIIAELLRNGLNQNNLKWHSAPANSEIEKIVLRWIAAFIDYPQDGGAILCSGGSVANFLSLAVMRKIMAPPEMSEDGLYGAMPMTVYVSEEGHSSLDKGLDMLGMGKKYLRKVPVQYDMTIDTTELQVAMDVDRAAGLRPIGIVGIAGTTNSGAVDPLDELADIAQQNNIWFMVDAAYGGPAAGTALAKDLFKGIERADSLVLNAHKWLFVPFEVACVFTKDKEHLRRTFSMVPAYLQGGTDKSDREDLMDFNLQLTKDFKALKVWMTMKTYGAQKLRLAVEEDIHMAQYLEELVMASDDFEMLAPVPLSIACFRYLPLDETLRDESTLNQINQRILDLIEEDGRIFLSGTNLKGKVSLRICCINHRRTKADIEFLVGVLRELGEKAVREV